MQAKLYRDEGAQRRREKKKRRREELEAAEKSEDVKSFTKPHWLKSCQLMPSRDCQSLFTPTRLEIQLQ
ncbi:Hypothetical protein FKW44_018254 [Caligus rogercresseyi]|uniref:Uncharacterized protein n=1 Tax=Caligus rogercresseyi TaxID=217165 RepID=A0A7T8GUP4_CALRO|nr:Hypothetical protein FKW44_018254 [Caligus rogercresseyi]